MKKFLALLLVLAGCATSPYRSSKPPVAEIVSVHEIHYELFSLMEEGSKLVVMDSRFVSLSESRTRELIRQALVKFNTHYVVEARDCDDLSVELTVKIRELFRQEIRIEAAAPVGIVGGALTGDIPELGVYMHGRIGYHAMVAVRCAGGKWLLVDPAAKSTTELASPIYEGCFEMFLGVF